MTQHTRPGARALVVVAGDDVYEDLFGASAELQQILCDDGFAASVGMGMGRFDRPIDDDLVILYTAMGEFRISQQQALSDAVRSGLGLVAIHSSNVWPGTPDAVDEAFRTAYELVGSRYSSHGPQPHESRFRVALDPAHPITAGLADFDITHEHYRLETTGTATTIASRLTDEGAEPLVQVREFGAGRVTYIQLGHDMRVWTEPGVREIIRRSARWASRETTRY
jgi:type 1 glutamine amidotransferase